MIVPDANLLLYAVDSESPFHSKAKAWLEQIMNGTEEVGLCSPVLFAFIRLSTNRKIFSNPLSLDDAFGYIQDWLNLPVCRSIQPSASYVQDVKRLLVQANSQGGNLVTDAQIAAIALHFKATVHTADRDFKRFADVNVKMPLTY